MPKKSILIATDNQRAIEVITSYFQGTESAPIVVRAREIVKDLKGHVFDYIFFERGWMGERETLQLKQLRINGAKVKFVALGKSEENGFAWDHEIMFPIAEKEFRKVVFGISQFPNPLKLLVVDDEAEILEAFQDYFGARRDPQFSIRTAQNGLQGFQFIQSEIPHCMVLDIKMPVRTGIELYRDTSRAGIHVPTIIFIDSTASDNISEIRKWGAPIFVEKGGLQSSMPEMLALIKKLTLFS